jgi:hypothetical protein
MSTFLEYIIYLNHPQSTKGLKEKTIQSGFDPQEFLDSLTYEDLDEIKKILESKYVNSNIVSFICQLFKINNCRPIPTNQGRIEHIINNLRYYIENKVMPKKVRTLSSRSPIRSSRSPIRSSRSPVRSSRSPIRSPKRSKTNNEQDALLGLLKFMQ